MAEAAPTIRPASEDLQLQLDRIELEANELADQAQDRRSELEDAMEQKRELQEDAQENRQDARQAKVDKRGLDQEVRGLDDERKKADLNYADLQRQIDRTADQVARLFKQAATTHEIYVREMQAKFDRNLIAAVGEIENNAQEVGRMIHAAYMRLSYAILAAIGVAAPRVDSDLKHFTYVEPMAGSTDASIAERDRAQSESDDLENQRQSLEGKKADNEAYFASHANDLQSRAQEIVADLSADTQSSNAIDGAKALVKEARDEFRAAEKAASEKQKEVRKAGRDVQKAEKAENKAEYEKNKAEQAEAKAEREKAIAANNAQREAAIKAQKQRAEEIASAPALTEPEATALLEKVSKAVLDEIKSGKAPQEAFQAAAAVFGPTLPKQMAGYDKWAKANGKPEFIEALNGKLAGGAPGKEAPTRSDADLEMFAQQVWDNNLIGEALDAAVDAEKLNRADIAKLSQIFKRKYGVTLRELIEGGSAAAPEEAPEEAADEPAPEESAPAEAPAE